MDRKRYKVTFEIETDEFLDECDLECSMEHMFPNWRKINVEETNSVPNSPNKDSINAGTKAHEDRSGSIPEYVKSNSDTIQSKHKAEIDKDYDKELNNKRLMALSGMNPYG